MIKQPMETAPRDGTKILLEYHNSYNGKLYPETALQEVYWREHDLGGSSPGWRAYTGHPRVESTERFPHPVGWYHNPREWRLSVIYIVDYLPAVGDTVFDSAWSTKEKAEGYLKTKRWYPGHWDLSQTTVDEGATINGRK